MKNDLARIDKQQEQFPDDAKPDNLKAYKVSIATKENRT